MVVAAVFRERHVLEHDVGRSEDASAAERQRFRKEVRRFLDVTAPLDFATLRALLDRLGSRWAPPSRQALVAWLSDAADGS